MKATVLVLALFAAATYGLATPAPAQFQPRMPAVPLPTPDPDFPLRLHILTIRWGSDTMHLYRSLQGELRGGPGYYQPTGSAHGFGTANLLGDNPQGLYYAFDCGSAFQPNDQPQDVYQARWKHPNQSLELLMQPVGSDRGQLCELKVSPRTLPFDPAFARTALPGSTLSGPLWNEPEVAFTDPAPDYPLHLHILTGYRRLYTGNAQGYGTANLAADGAPVQGVDYNYTCSHGLIPNAQPNEFFQGHWVKKDQRMEILLQRIGSDHVDRCELNISLKPTPYANLPATPTTASSQQPAFSHPLRPHLQLESAGVSYGFLDFM